MTDGTRTPEALLRDIDSNSGCVSCDLTDVDFDALDPSQDLVFRDCDVSSTKLRGDALTGSSWESCRFLSCEFISTALRGAVFRHCNFFDADMKKGAMFRFCTMRDVQFLDCNLSLSQFVGCTARDILFEDCKMRGTLFENVTFSADVGRRRVNGARFERCILDDALLARLDLSACTFQDCGLVNASLVESDFFNASLKGCDLTLAEIEDAVFSGADLRGSNLSGFDLRAVKEYAGAMISATQQHHLLRSIGIEVYPDED